MDRLFQLSNQLAINQLSAPQPSQVETELLDNGRIAVIYMNSPKDLNSLNAEMKNELCAAVNKFDSNDSVQVMILTSQLEKAFCAGADIKEFPAMTHEALLLKDMFRDFDRVFYNIQKPIIAAVGGVAFGGGFEIALCCDIIVCSETAQFAFPEVKLGLFPGLGGTQRLTQLAGKVNAMRYILTGDAFDAKEAERMNVTAMVCQKQELFAQTIELAQKISDKSLYVGMATQSVINQAQNLGINDGLQFERTVFNSIFNLKAKNEGVDAFIQQRKYNFDKL